MVAILWLLNMVYMKRNSSGRIVGGHWRNPKPFWNKSWCEQEYLVCGRSAKDIATSYNVTESAVLYWLGKHHISTRSMVEIRQKKYWGESGVDNPMWNRKGELNPNWKGGVTPERQAFYQSQEWKRACSFVWRRDNATCQRCSLLHSESLDMPFHIHHIKSFSVVETRVTVTNLVLLCETCHHFVHSKRNVDGEYL